MPPPFTRPAGTHAAHSTRRGRQQQALGSKSKRDLLLPPAALRPTTGLIKGVAYAHQNRGKQALLVRKSSTTRFLHTLQYLEKQGFEVTYLPVDEYGLISLDDLKGAIRTDTIPITMMFANNEIGTIEPIKEIA